MTHLVAIFKFVHRVAAARSEGKIDHDDLRSSFAGGDPIVGWRGSVRWASVKAAGCTQEMTTQQHAERWAVRFQARSSKKVTLFPFVAAWSDQPGAPDATWEGAPQIRAGFARRLLGVWQAYTSHLGLDPCWRVIWYPVDRNGYALVRLERDRGRWQASALLVSRVDVAAAGMDPFIFWFGAMHEPSASMTSTAMTVTELSARAQRNLLAAWRAGEVRSDVTGVYTAMAAQLEALKIPGAAELTLPSGHEPSALGNLVMAWPRLSPQLRNQLSLVVAPDGDGVEALSEPRAVCVYTPGAPAVSAGAEDEALMQARDNKVIQLSSGAQRFNRETPPAEPPPRRSPPEVAAAEAPLADAALDEDAPSQEEEWEEAMESLSASWERPRPPDLIVTPDPLDAVLAEEAEAMTGDEELQAALMRLAGRPSAELTRAGAEQPHQAEARRRPGAAAPAGRSESGRRAVTPPPLLDAPVSLGGDVSFGGDASLGGEGMRDDGVGPARGGAGDFEVEIMDLGPEGPMGEVVSLPDRLATRERERLAEESIAELALIGLSTGRHPAIRAEEEPEEPDVPELSAEERLLQAWGLEKPFSPVLLWEGVCNGDAQWHMARLMAAIEESCVGERPSEAFPVEASLKGPEESVALVREQVARLAQGPIPRLRAQDGEAGVERGGVAAWCRPRRNIWARVGRGGGVGAGAGAVVVAPVSGSLAWPRLAAMATGAVVVVSAPELIHNPQKAAMELDDTLRSWVNLRDESPLHVAVVLSQLEALREPKQEQLAAQVMGTLGRIAHSREAAAGYKSLDDMGTLGGVLLKALGLSWVQERFATYGLSPAFFALASEALDPEQGTVHDLPLLWLLDRCRVRLNLARRSA